MARGVSRMRHGLGANHVSRAAPPLARLRRQSLGVLIRFTRCAPYRRMKARPRPAPCRRFASPTRPLAVAATDDGRRRNRPPGIRLREGPAMLLGCGPRRSDAARHPRWYVSAAEQPLGIGLVSAAIFLDRRLTFFENFRLSVPLGSTCRRL